MKRYIIALLILACITGINAQDNRLLIKDLDLKAYISLDKENYRLGEDIYLSVEIINQSSDYVEFDTSAYKLNNSKLLVRNLQTGELLEEKYSKIIKDNKLKASRPELFKLNKTALYTDEILKFKLNLPEYFEFNEMGRYKVFIEFDPFPANSKKHKIHISNPIYLILKDRLMDEEYKELVNYLKETEEKKRYTPNGAIDFMLESYKNGDWENYFRYQDLDKIILQYHQFRDKYQKASSIMKKKIIGDFKKWVMEREEKEIKEYEILNIDHSYKDKTSVVKCRITYKKPALYRSYIYEFNLYQNGIKWWTVNDISVITYSKK